MSKENKTNRLINSSSPYLLQHAHNPVDWHPWDNEALNQALSKDKPIIVSIGYSACHWCHVMEKQSFENQEVAQLMNDNFICIKVDREERPDVDQIYMDALQAMGLRGGWPLNVFLTPNQKPFYGGTYFPPDGWMDLLRNVTSAYKEKRQELEESAENFTKHINDSDIEKYNIGKGQIIFTQDQFNHLVILLEEKFDFKWGGLKKSPKFPMPPIWNLLLDIFHHNGNQKAGKMAHFTLLKMAAGGIYDHIGGGFARYSTDEEWHIPHFEKMLYDNGQLLSLYAKGYRLFKDDAFEKVIHQTVDWLDNEMLDSTGGFYSAIDADSEDEEGKFYNWSYADFEELAGKESEVLKNYFNITKEGNWEEGKNTLRILNSIEDVAYRFNLETEQLKLIINTFEQKGYHKRSERIWPEIDNKILTGWNGLTLIGLIESYKATGSKKAKTMAVSSGNFLNNHILKNGQLYRNYQNGNVSITGYLEDYAWVLNAFLELYQITFDLKWIHASHEIAQYLIENFHDKAEGFFFYTNQSSTSLIARKKEIFDNVIPSSNSGIASGFYKLGQLLDNREYTEIARKMVNDMSRLIHADPEYLAHWGSVMLQISLPATEVIFAGNINDTDLHRFYKYESNNMLFMKSNEKSQEFLPLTRGKNAIDEKSTFYICHNKTCQLPVTDLTAALNQIKNYQN